MATAVVEERQLLKTLRWYDGFVIALANPGFLLGSLGYSVGDLGGWGAALLWGISALVAVFINTIYSELAAMFPEKSGGLALYAHEAWRKYTTLVGPIATFGYWIGWSVVLSFNGLFIGQIVQGAWFPGEPFGGASNNPDVTGYFSTGTVKVGLPQLIAIGLILAVWLFNVFGVRVGVTFGYLAGALLMVPLFVMMILPFLNGSFDSANLDNSSTTTDLGVGRAPARARLAMAHVLVGVGGGRLRDLRPGVQGHGPRHEAARSGRPRCSRWSSTSCSRSASSAAARRSSSARYDYVGAMDKIVGSTTLHGLLRRLSRGRFIITMNTATADGGRALYGISRAGMTVKQLGTLNRWHVPGNAMTVDMVINICFVLFIGNIFGVLAASNLGYVLAHMFALSGFVLLRRDRPELAETDQALGHLDADRRPARRVVPDPDGRRLRLDAGRRRWLRRQEGEDHRRVASS